MGLGVLKLRSGQSDGFLSYRSSPTRRKGGSLKTVNTVAEAARPVKDGVPLPRQERAKEAPARFHSARPGNSPS